MVIFIISFDLFHAWVIISPLIPTAAVPVAHGIGCVIRHAVAGITIEFPTQDFILRGVNYIYPNLRVRHSTGARR